jgi:hypothetical protein
LNGGRLALVLEDPGGMPLDQLLDEPLELQLWVRLAIGLSSVICHLHQRRILDGAYTLWLEGVIFYELVVYELLKADGIPVVVV